MTRRPLAATLLALAFLVASERDAAAKAPELTGIFPAGAARGASVTATITGKFDRWPVTCWVDGAGLSVKAGGEKGKLIFDVAADAQPGVRWVRIHDDEGASGLRPFLVGVLPEIMETEPNDDPRRPQVVEKAQTTINGRLSKSGDVDGYSVKLERGQKLVADLEASRRLGSPMDAVLQVVSAEGFVLAQNNDAVGEDPRIRFEAPATGAYVVRLFAFPSKPDSSIRFAGGPDYIYRLTLTTGGFVEHAFPLAASREKPTAIAAVGPNIPSAEAGLVVPDDGPPDWITVTHPSMAGDARVRIVAGVADVEVEPNDPANPQRLPDRGAVTGRIDPPGDRDAYRIALKKGEKRVFRLESRSIGLPLDAVLQVVGPDGKTIAEADDARNSSDPVITYTPSVDGDFRVVVRDLHRRGGPNFAYLLSVLTPDPDFGASLAADKFDLKPGEPTKVVVTIDRRNGFSEPLEVVAEGLPDGVEATTAVSHRSGDSAKSVTLEIRGDGRARSGPFRIVARSADGRGRGRAAVSKIAGFEAETDRPWLAVIAAPGLKKP
jgi:hypothetical protein